MFLRRFYCGKNYETALIKGLLDAFENSKERALTLIDLQKAGFDYEKDENHFIFHMQLLCDENLIDREQGHNELQGTKIFGLLPHSGGYTLQISPLRLTMAGHEFATNIRNKQIWSKLKESIKDQGFSAIVTFAKELSVGYAKKQVKKLLSEE